MEHEWHWHQNEWLLLIDVVVHGLWCPAVCVLFLFAGEIGWELGDGAGFIAMLAVLAVGKLGHIAWQLIKRGGWYLIRS